MGIKKKILFVGRQERQLWDYIIFPVWPRASLVESEAHLSGIWFADIFENPNLLLF